jgi:hypothetical protein
VAVMPRSLEHWLLLVGINDHDHFRRWLRHYLEE